MKMVMFILLHMSGKVNDHEDEANNKYTLGYWMKLEPADRQQCLAKTVS